MVCLFLSSSGRFKTADRKESAFFFSLTAFVVLLGIYNYPVFTGVFFNWSNKYSTRVKVPDYILEAKKELDSNSFSARTLMLPQLHDGNKYIAYDWKYFSLSSIPSILSRKPVLLNDAVLSGDEPGLVNAIYQQLEKSSQSSLLKYVGVDRAIVQEDFKVDEDMDYLTGSIKRHSTARLIHLYIKKLVSGSFLLLTTPRQNLSFISHKIFHIFWQKLHNFLESVKRQGCLLWQTRLYSSTLAREAI